MGCKDVRSADLNTFTYCVSRNSGSLNHLDLEDIYISESRVLSVSDITNRNRWEQFK